VSPTETKALQVQRGLTERQEFGAFERDNSGETAIAAVAARERSIIEAQYLMAERHPRNWMDVRARMMDHCLRPRFAEVSRYKKPVGKKKINGEWVDQYAEGYTIRFAESLAQEMRNVKPESSVTYEDDLIRILRIGVTDLQSNVPWSREVAFGKVIEKRGFQDRQTKEWAAPDGREVVGQPRVNSRGEMTYTVKATEDEMRSKVNSEISKTQRDFIIKLCPRDLLEDWHDAVYATMEKEDKRDPKAALKKWLDAFHRMGIEPSDLENYFAKSVNALSDADIKELRELGTAINEGVTTFQQAMELKWKRTDEDGNEVKPGTVEREKVLDQKLTEAHAAQQVKQEQGIVINTSTTQEPNAEEQALWKVMDAVESRTSKRPNDAQAREIQKLDNTAEGYWDAVGKILNPPPTERPKPVFGKRS
jgi:hypothetical protein